MNELEILKQKVNFSVEKKHHYVTQEIINRIKYEFKYIEKHNLALFFLSISKIFSELKQKNIYVSSYSAMSSIICYYIGISSINPIDYGLLSERVFNNRTSVKDFVIYANLDALNFVEEWIEKNLRFLNKIPELSKEIKNCFVINKDITFLNNAIRIIQKERNIYFFPNKLFLSDYLTICLFQSGTTDNIPNFSTKETKKLLKKIQPKNIVDLANLFVLNQIHKLTPDFNPKKQLNISDFINETNGIIIYQEQFISIIQELSYFTEEQAEEFRFAYSLKKFNEINEYKNLFIEMYRPVFSINTILRNRNKEAKRILNYLLENLNYTYYKSFALYTAIISYQIAYVKIHYSVIFNEIDN